MSIKGVGGGFDSDEVVYRRYLSRGDEADLRTLLERHRESLTLFVNEFVRDLDDAEEIMLDAFAVVASGTSRFDGRSSFRTWLFSISRKLAASHLRKRRFSVEQIPDREDESLPATDYGMLSEERNRTLYDALGRLAPEYRQVLYLTFFEEMDVDEVARVMRKTPKQVYNLTYRGKQALKEALERMGFSDEID